MRENNRNSIEKCRKKLPQFTTMNVIDGQAGLISYFSLIFYSLTIDNILNIIILIILATITINIAFGDNGLIKRAEQAKDLYANGSTSELDILNQVDEYLNEKIDKVTKPDTPVEPVIPYTEVYATLYEDGTLGFSNDESKIEGLTPISEKSWNITDETFSAEWGLEEAPYYKATTPWFEDRESITKVVFSNEIVPKSVTALFMGCTNLTTIEGIENLNTSNVSSLSAMFDDCVSLTSIDLSNFKTSNVTDMNHMFAYCPNLTNIDVSGFKTNNVTDMSYMFWNCTKLKSINLSNFNTSKVTAMSYMFCDCYSLTSLNLSSFETSKVTDMFEMFARM